MADYGAAIGRDVGKVDTDGGGLARYSLKLQVPPGIRHGTEPELSFEYCQGTPNGSLGVGWALGGVSAIRKAPSNLAFDDINPPPASYDRASSKLTLDGAELLNIQGDYHASHTQYTTEIDSGGRTVTPLGTGFVVVDSTGRRLEYGTSEDSLILSTTDKTPREWRLKRNIDYHGNTITYRYSSSPQPGSSSLDKNACYLWAIEYTSNIKTGHAASRIVNFEYISRPDPVVQVSQGEKCIWASLLAAVRFGVVRNDQTRTTRSYEITYDASKATSDSRIVSIAETAFDGTKKVSLTPSTFGYTDAGVEVKDMFRTATGADRVVRLAPIEGSVALFPMNISGRSLADIACVKKEGQRLSIKTFLASRKDDGILSWAPSTGTGAEATLPIMDLSKGFPNIVMPDINNDGRPDLVVPYADSDNRIRFSMSQCIGTGFQNYTEKRTDFRWVDGSKFMTMDITGRGASIIQIFTDRNQITLRNFPTFNENNQIGLKDAVVTSTSYENKGTIDWIQLTHSSNGAKSLVRVWSQDLGSGQSQFKATPFTIHNTPQYNGKFQEGPTSLLGEPFRTTQKKFSVLSCDINADGVQDIVLASAEYKADRMELSFSTYLGDGDGSFSSHGDTVVKALPSARPLKSPEYGNFHLTNLDGSNYPSISYMYQAVNKTYYCFSVDGQSDGLFGQSQIYTIAGDIPAENMQVAPTDLNGNGIVDWLFHTVENSIPRMLPVYNAAQCVDLISWARDPMGLRTGITYGTLSDPSVYISDVKWDDYKDKDRSPDSYPVISAPSYVVTRLDHKNDSAINSLEFQVSITKRYANARINVLGRGWQGFKQIHSVNTADGVLTTESYIQQWPLTSIKEQVDTKTSTGNVLKTVKTSFERPSIKRGDWKIFRTNRVMESTEHMEDSVSVRKNWTRSEYDSYGNMTLHAVAETQRDQTMHQSFKRCTYKVLDGVTGVLTAEKFSLKSGNVDMDRYEDGDVTFILYENEDNRAVLKNTKTWSTEAARLISKQFTFDQYGRQTRSLDAAGLETTTFYDGVFQTFPVKTVQSGPGFDFVDLKAFDEATGMEVGNLTPDGRLTCYKIDGFGRTIETRAPAPASGSQTVKAGNFLASNDYVADAALGPILDQSELDPQRLISFEIIKSPQGPVYLGTRIKTIAGPDAKGQGQVLEYVTCARQIRKRSSWNGNDMDKTCVWWDFDSRGQQIVECYPTKVSASQELDWRPAVSSLGIRSSYDSLGRQNTSIRPAHGAPGQYILTSSAYLDGGARIQEKTLSTSDAGGRLDNGSLLCTIERRYIHIDHEDYVIENVDENGQRSTFQYDVLGRLLATSDPSGQEEARVYSSLGNLMSLDNSYQNPMKSSTNPALRYMYNAAGQMIRSINAAGDTVKSEPDARGRVLTKTGGDGRLVQYTYEGAGRTSVSSIKVFPGGMSQPFETCFDISYDHRGRASEQKLTLADGSTLVTKVEYDWQDRVIRKTLPDGTILTNDFNGSELTSRTLSDRKAETWNLKAETSQYTAFGRPEKVTVSGTGLKEAFNHHWEYDSQGFPLKHALRTTAKTLVQEHYTYNDLDQIKRKHEYISGETADYTYKGRRLASSQIGQGETRKYGYDNAGNIIERRGATLMYAPGQVKGVKGGAQEFEVVYDSAGRTIQRTTAQSTLTMSYNSLEALSAINDAKTNASVTIISNAEGEMIQRKHSDESSDLFVNDDLVIHTRADGKREFQHRLTNGNHADGTEHVVATVTTAYESADSTRTLSGQRSSCVHFADTKGNVTHVFSGDNSELKKKLDYDEYGLIEPEKANKLEEDANSTYEGKFFDAASGLLCFGARWYDPLIGRFTVPDDILDIASLLRNDGLNRYVFENNDPINHVDPTGHWSWSSILGVVIGVVLVVAAVAVTVATFGAASPILAGAVVGALAGGGIAGIQYSVKHKDEEDAGKFW